MKKFLVTILTILYLTTSTGAVVHLHYCMGKFISWGLKDVTNHNTCAKCSMEKKNRCCGDKKIIVKGDKDQRNFEVFPTPLKAPVTIIHHFYSDYTFNYLSKKVEVISDNNPPPCHADVPIYIYNCTFRI